MSYVSHKMTNHRQQECTCCMDKTGKRKCKRMSRDGNYNVPSMDTNKQCQHTASINQLLLAKCAHTSRSLTMLGCSYLIRISTSSCGSRLWGSTTWTHLRQMTQCLYRCISMIHHRYAAAHHSNIVNNTITVIINDTTVHLPTRTHTHTHTPV